MEICQTLRIWAKEWVFIQASPHVHQQSTYELNMTKPHLSAAGVSLRLPLYFTFFITCLFRSVSSNVSSAVSSSVSSSLLFFFVFLSSSLLIAIILSSLSLSLLLVLSHLIFLGCLVLPYMHSTTLYYSYIFLTCRNGFMQCS